MAMGRNSKQGTIGLGISLCLAVGANTVVAAPSEIDIEGLLKQAETACVQGDTVQLAALSQQLRTLAKQPALQAKETYLNQYVGLLGAGVCQPGQATLTKRSRPAQGQATNSPITKTSHVLVSAGYLDNVNQGSRHERITIINPFNGLLVEGRLDERNLPLSSGFVAANGTYRVVDAQRGTVTAASVARQEYLDEPDFSTTAFSMSRFQALNAGKEATAYVNMIRDDSGNTERRIGGVYYQPWVATPKQKTGIFAGVEYVTYPEQKVYQAAVSSVALEHRKALPHNGEISLRGRLELDYALENRPGDDRKELELSAQWKGKPLWAGWQPSAGARVAYKRDSKPFDPNLYGDSTRTQTRKGVDLVLSKAIGNNKKVQVSYQYGQTEDKEVPLFDQPAGSAVGMAFETSF